MTIFKRKTKLKKKGICVYCGESKFLTNDHIPPKNLFPSPRPNNLITVPSCSICNLSASKDDEYFRFALTGREDTFQSEAVQKIYSSVARSFHKPQKVGFRKSLLNSFQVMNRITPSGIYLGKVEVFNVDLIRLNSVASRIIKGLFYHHSNLVLPKTSSAVAYILDDFQKIKPQDLLGIRDDILVPLSKQESFFIGEGVFEYKYIFNGDYEFLSVWFLRFFNKVIFIGMTIPKDLKK